MKTYAFIFARGGSKGLPRKNIKQFCGKPLIAHSIEVARSVASISEIYVSTDDIEIEKVATEYQAKVILRPHELATDTSPEIESWKHAVRYLRDSGNNFDRFISIPATAPLRIKKDLEDTLKALSDFTDIAVTVSNSSRNPHFNLMKYNEDGFLETFSEGNSFHRRQDAPKCYDLTTVAYVTRPDYILNSTNILDGNVSAVNIPPERAIDIDNEMDFYVAEALLNRRINAER